MSNTTWICHECNTENPGDLKYCMNCRRPAVSTMCRCSFCGKESRAVNDTCVHCGASLKEIRDMDILVEQDSDFRMKRARWSARQRRCVCLRLLSVFVLLLMMMSAINRQYLIMNIMGIVLAITLLAMIISTWFLYKSYEELADILVLIVKKNLPPHLQERWTPALEEKVKAQSLDSVRAGLLSGDF